MGDPYSILGITESATDEEVKQAYRTLAKKYHPDNYNDSPLAEYASEKMKEINEAYDAIMDERRTTRKAEKSAGGYGYYANVKNSNYSDVRSFINSGRFDDAEQILNGVPSEGRNAEWYYLKGVVLRNRGWIEDAFQHFQTACQKDPSNKEYQAAYKHMSENRNGSMGGYSTRGGTCSVCDICTGLMCMDCCCDCCDCFGNGC